MPTKDIKKNLLKQLQQIFVAELENLERSAQAAAENATHAENKPEHKYDTRALEASYLAGAQRERSLELRAALMKLENLPMRVFSDDDSIAITALIELQEGDRVGLYLLMPVGAGYRFLLDAKEVTTITTQSPLGKLLPGKYVGDVVTISTTQGNKEYEIVSVM